MADDPNSPQTPENPQYTEAELQAALAAEGDAIDPNSLPDGLNNAPQPPAPAAPPAPAQQPDAMEQMQQAITTLADGQRNILERLDGLSNPSPQPDPLDQSGADELADIRRCEKMMGNGSFDPQPEEMETLKWAKKDPETNQRRGEDFATSQSKS